MPAIESQGQTPIDDTTSCYQVPEGKSDQRAKARMEVFLNKQPIPASEGFHIGSAWLCRSLFNEAWMNWL